jgi:hypothetical protein
MVWWDEIADIDNEHNYPPCILYVSDPGMQKAPI